MDLDLVMTKVIRGDNVRRKVIVVMIMELLMERERNVNESEILVIELVSSLHTIRYRNNGGEDDDNEKEIV
jgi:hypothetical protein